jgi:hypothetical protein
MKNLSGMAALVRDIWNDREEFEKTGLSEEEMVIYWHSAFEAVRLAIESTIDYFQFGLGCPENFAFDWYVASLELNDFSAESDAILSSDEALSMAFSITQLKPMELSQFVYELQVWYQEITQLYQDVQATTDLSERFDSNRKQPAV